MYQHEYQKRVRYSEVDKMGYLYYGNYAQLYEIGRVEWLRSLGITYREMEDDQKVMMPVVSMECKFIKPAYYDDLLTVVTTLRQMPSFSITFDVEVFNEEKKKINVGVVRLCFVDMKTSKVIEMPDFLIVKLKPFFG
jgi:acyl-CoA thioester hydrolase